MNSTEKKQGLKITHDGLCNMEAKILLEMLNAIEIDLYFLLFKVCVVLFVSLMLSNFIRSAAIYVKLRFSDLFSKRTVIVYDGFKGVIEEISMAGIFIRNKDGVTKFIPLNRWYMGDIQYPNSLGEDES